VHFAERVHARHLDDRPLQSHSEQHPEARRCWWRDFAERRAEATLVGGGLAEQQNRLFVEAPHWPDQTSPILMVLVKPSRCKSR